MTFQTLDDVRKENNVKNSVFLEFSFPRIIGF